jgi:hypothetical protein
VPADDAPEALVREPVAEPDAPDDDPDDVTPFDDPALPELVPLEPGVVDGLVGVGDVVGDRPGVVDDGDDGDVVVVDELLGAVVDGVVMVGSVGVEGGVGVVLDD